MAYADGNEILFSANVNVRGKLENKEITENGTYTASEGFHGIGQVVVNVENPTQEKTVDITENGTTEVTADEGFTLSKVTANVNVSASGENKFAQLVDGTITEVTAEDLAGITEIMASTFYKRINLAKVILPDSVKKIGGSAFSECSNLSEIQLNNVEELGASSFNACKKLEEFIAPNVKQVGRTVFHTCTNLRVLKLTNPNLTLNNVESLLYMTSNVDIYFSLPLENIYCFSTSSASLFNGASGCRIFINDELIENAVFPNTVTKLKNGGVKNNKGFKTVTFLGDMTEICDYGFAECVNLEKISFPNCTSVPILKGTNLLSGTGKVSAIEVPTSLYDEWIASTNWSKIASKIVAI